MKLSRELVDDERYERYEVVDDEPSDTAQSGVSKAHGRSGTGESWALAWPSISASGEITQDETPHGSTAFSAAFNGTPRPRREQSPIAEPTDDRIPSIGRGPQRDAEADHAEQPTNIDVPAGSSRWRTYEEVGLAPKPLTRMVQRLLVSAYRLLGFGILSLIVVVLLGYIATTAFYFLNHTWITPVALSANDEKVVALQGELAAQLNARAKLVGELEQAEGAISFEQGFQLQFGRAIKTDLRSRRLALGRAQALAHTAAATRDEIRTTNGDYSVSTVTKMDAEYQAGLINRDAMLAGKFQLAQISSANLSLAERQAEFDQRSAELAAQAQSLDALLANKTDTAALSYDVLKIARDYETSKLAVARELGNRERLKASIERQDKIIAGLEQSAYLRAISDRATVALVPYANLGGIKKGTPLYACKLSMVLCHEVGTVLDVLSGEVLVKHPTRDAMVRGRMIEMQMTDDDAAQDEVLFAGRPPLGM